MASRLSARRGFTLIESLITLGVIGLVLSLMFMVGTRSSILGFRLGARALDTAGAEVTRAAYRSILSDIVLPPVALSSEAAELEMEEVDDSFVGTPDQMAGWLIAGRETPCALAGTAGRMTVYPEQSDELETIIWCQLDANEPIELMRLRWPGAVFQYSEDGLEWYDEWIVERGMPVEQAVLPNGEMRKVMVRLTALDGRGQLIEMAQSGRALPQTAAAAGGGGGGGGGGGNNPPQGRGGGNNPPQGRGGGVNPPQGRGGG